MSLTIVQLLPALEVGGVEQGTVELAAELVRQGHRSIVVSRPGRMLPALLGAGSEHLAWPVGDKRLGTLRYVRTLRRLLIDARVDVLHARSRLPGWIAYWAWRGLPRARRPSFVTTVHGPYTVNPYSAVMMRGERVIAISDYIRDYIRDNYPQAADRVELIHRGVAAERYPYGYRPPKEWLQQWYRDFPQTEDRYLVTLPARITRWKGQAEFIDVLRRLSAADIPVHGLLAGAAEPRQAKFLAELEQRIDAHGLNARVSLLGQRADLREVLALSDVVLSLANEPEAFGRTTLEALRMGRPVVGYDHGGTHEVLGEMFPAGACPPGDTDTVVQKVQEFYRYPPNVPAIEAFPLQRMLDQTIALYQALCE